MSRRFRFSENTHIEECVAMPSKQLLARMDRRRQRQGAPSLLSDNFSSIISTVAGMSTRLAVACPVQQTTAVASPVQQKKQWLALFNKDNAINGPWFAGNHGLVHLVNAFFTRMRAKNKFVRLW